MIDEVFDISNFNIFSDDENYYFFRTLEDVDIESIKNKTITDENGNINRLITDREFYGETIFKKEDDLSLEQMVEHIKMHYNQHTNCISFSSNTNVILDYGRNVFNDIYIMLKVPKSEFGKNIVNAGEYMLEEINKRLDEYYNNLDSNNNDDALTKYYFDYINNSETEEQLEDIRNMITKDYVDETNNIFINGLEKITDSINYGALNKKQNLLKNKIYLKMDIMSKYSQILKKISNKFLVNTVGNAFSSIEVIHYNDVVGNITEISPEIMDVLSLIQQMKETPIVKELKNDIIRKINSGIEFTHDFNLKKYDINTFKNSLNLEKIYELTKGNIKYGDAINIYTKAYALAKSRLRKERSLELLKEILNDNKYDSVIESMKTNTYGIENEIINRLSNKNSIKISESVNLLVSPQERYLLDYINQVDENKLEDILRNPTKELQNLIEDNYTDEYITENWFANSVIDLIDWSYYNVKENLSEGQRELLINSLKENNFMDIYNNLKEKKFSDKDIANIILLKMVRKDENVDIKDIVSLDELEDFLGCNQIKNTEIKLKTYQREAIENINEAYKNHKFTSVILPTGTGKSYVALSEMHYIEKEISKLEENKHAKILYLAPNDYILSQLKRIIVKNYRESYPFSYSDEDVVKNAFPNLSLYTYQYLTNGTNSDEIINSEYDLIVFDELHRTGAAEWQKNIEKLLENQPAKVLGITATPERDMDKRDMSEIFAKKYGYTDDEILDEKHLSYNMDLLEAIERGIIHSPNVVNCEYSLIKDGSLDELKLKIDDIIDENLKKEKRREYEKVRREISEADGIDKILKDNLKQDDKYIVFIPITKNKNGEYVNAESGEEMTKTQAQSMIRSYQNLMNQLLFSGEYLEKNKEKLSSIYNKINENKELSSDEITYLNEEKESILLLTKLHVNNMPNALQTLSNDISSKIIEYMNWEVFADSKIASTLHKKLKNDVETYNMLSDNSKKQNTRALSDFNSSKSPKKKFMFVMDMLNEGVHVEQIDGIIWFRTLNEDSRILFLQQLGRCISAIGEDNKERIPLVIDLVNNTLKVNFLKSLETEESDLKKIKYISNWIKHTNRIPDINSSNKEELELAISLREIQFKYSKFTNDDKLELQTVKRKRIVNQIIRVGSEFDLWNYEFSIDSNSSEITNEKSHKDLLSKLGVNGILRNFYDLYKNVNKINNIDINSILKEINEYLQNQKEKITSYATIMDRLRTTGGKIGYYLLDHKKEIIELSDKNAYAQTICNYFGWLNEKITIEDVLKEINEYLRSRTTKITNYTRIKDTLKTTGGQIGNYLFAHKKEIIQLSKENKNAKEICNYFNWQKEKITIEDVLKEINEYLKNQTEEITNCVTIKDRLKTTGGQIGNYLSRYKVEIIELSKENNDANEICNYFGWLKKKITKEDVLKEINEYLKKQKEKITNYKRIKDRLKTTGGQIGNYLIFHKKEIIELSGKNNDANEICNYFGWLKKKITKEDVLKEINEYLKKQKEKITNYKRIKDRLKTTGGQIGNYLIFHKKEIIELSGKNNDANEICNYFGWLKKKITKEDVLKEINEYLRSRTTKITNYTKIKDTLKTTGGQIGNYLVDHKDEIIELLDKNDDAQAICNYFNWLVKIEDILKEINKYLQSQIEKIINYTKIKDTLKTTGGQIGNYLVDHKDEIIELLDKNDDAQAICNYFGWQKEKITIEDVLKEINEYLQNQKEKITNYAKIKEILETTRGQIGYYLSDHKDEIINLAINGNSDALYICNYFKSFQKILYKKIDEIANADSHFQNVVDNLEKGKENIDGRKLH